MMKKLHAIVIKRKNLVLGGVFFLLCLAAVVVAPGIFSQIVPVAWNEDDASYVILAASPSGMHCYQPDFTAFMILPPANDLRVQVIRKVGGDAQLVTGGIEVRYEIIDNTTSADKTNFWKYAADYGYDVPPGAGITGNGLSGTMELSADGKVFEVDAIPLTPYNDGSKNRNPYQLARITVTDTGTGKVLAATDDVVVPVSDEMDCATCHGTTNTGLNILRAHDELSGTDLVEQIDQGKRYKCSDCHEDTAQGQPGKEGVLPLSQAMHGFHADKMAQSDVTPNCYSCHPGPVTQCNRGRMYLAGITCDNPKCHGSMANVAKTQAEGRQAWLQEPDCGSCHGTPYAVNAKKLYRDSLLNDSTVQAMNGIMLCLTCHNSPHAEWRSSLPKDNLLPTAILGYPSFIDKCSACHEGMEMGKVHADGK